MVKYPTSCGPVGPVGHINEDSDQPDSQSGIRCFDAVRALLFWSFFLDLVYLSVGGKADTV